MASKRNHSEISKQLNTDMDIIFPPQTILDVLTEVSMIHDASIKSSKFHFHIHLLEEESKKVYAFKSELPYCMQLLQDAIEMLRKECLRLREREEGPVVVTEELIPIQNDHEGDRGVESSTNLGDMKNWMSRVRLWTAPVKYHSGNEAFPIKSMGGVIVPPRKSMSTTTMKEGKRIVPARKLSHPIEEGDYSTMKDDFDILNYKKPRRCWSPTLHNQFVNALQNLGGPYVATPKQIRELMKVEGLTNDEVKSHLQKYRLHIKKLPSSSVGFVDASLTTVADPSPPDQNHP